MQEIKIYMPQFDRTDNVIVTPAELEDFQKLHTYSEEELRDFGLQKWDEPDKDGNVLWLFPAEWYDSIPDGLEIVDVFGEKSTFKSGATDNDRRFGALSYGILRKLTPQPPVEGE